MIRRRVLAALVGLPLPSIGCALATKERVTADEVQRELEARLPPGTSESDLLGYFAARGIAVSYVERSNAYVYFIRNTQVGLGGTKNLQVTISLDEARHVRAIAVVVRNRGWF